MSKTKCKKPVPMDDPIPERNPDMLLICAVGTVGVAALGLAVVLKIAMGEPDLAVVCGLIGIGCVVSSLIEFCYD